MPPMGRDPATPAWIQHIAFKVDSEAVLMEMKAKLEAAGIEVLGVTDHGIFRSIYFHDPNGHRLELVADTATPGTDEAPRRSEVADARRVVAHEEGAEARGVDARARVGRRSRRGLSRDRYKGLELLKTYAYPLSVARAADHVVLTVETPDGVFRMAADWLIACDGANSDTRRMVGADFAGQVFQDRFLIADVVAKADFPAERRFWFDPPFHRGQSALLHKECDNVWRLDFQLGWDADPVEEQKPENVIRRIRQMLGDKAEFELEWASVYQFACRRIDQFRHDRILFAGDSAHQVSPFGARGANTGVQDADNLAWKLALVIDGKAPASLLDSYHEERGLAADDNIRNSTRSTDFITPKSRASRNYRDAVLELSATEPFARPLVNSGRLSTPTPYRDSSLNTPDESPFAGAMQPGTNCADAPVTRDGKPGWLLNQLGAGFVLLAVGGVVPREGIEVDGVRATALTLGSDIQSMDGVLADRYDRQPGTVYLIRPDQHVAARWRRFEPHKATAALARCLGHPANAANAVNAGTEK